MTWLRRHFTAVGVVLTTSLYLATSWIMTYSAGVFIGDALSRMANTYYVLFSRDPHLAAVGFVWTPLQNFLELPLIFLLRPVGLTLWAGGILSALFSGLNLVLLKRVLNQVGLDGWPCFVLMAIYALNPFVIFYAADGMTEALFFTTMFALISCILTWRESGKPGGLMAAGLACAAGFGFRYESFALAAAGVAIIAVVWWVRHRGDLQRLEGESLAFLMPFAYTVGLWLLANWLIEGSPIYFLNVANNSEVRKSWGWGGAGSSLTHNLVPAAEYVLVRCFWFMPALIPLLLLAIGISLLQRRVLALAPLIFPAAVVTFSTYMLYSGSSAGWFRYYSASIPLGILAAALVLAALKGLLTQRARSIQWIATAIVLGATAFSAPSTLHAMTQPTIGADEHGPLDVLFGHRSAAGLAAQWQPDRAMAAYLDSLRLPEGSVVTDTTTGFAVVMFSRHPAQFVIPSDRDFDLTFSQLSSFHGYVLVCTRTNPISIITVTQYPGLLHNSISWAHLQHRAGPWLLYKIQSSGP